MLSACARAAFAKNEAVPTHQTRPPLSMLQLAVLATALLLTACNGDDRASNNPPHPPEAAATSPSGPSRVDSHHRFPIAVGDTTVQMRLAILPHEQRRGLMHIRSMPEDEGMLFVYESGRQVSFWMRNTYIPLDIGFFDEDGVLQEIYPMYPHVEDPVRSSAANIRYCLEVNQGWFARHGVGIGARIDLDALASAIAARGFAPRRYVGAGNGF